MYSFPFPIISHTVSSKFVDLLTEFLLILLYSDQKHLDSLTLPVLILHVTLQLLDIGKKILPLLDSSDKDSVLIMCSQRIIHVVQNRVRCGYGCLISVQKQPADNRKTYRNL